MYVTQVYKYELDGITYVGAASVPEGATVIEEMNILNANEGYDLLRISTEEVVGNSIWLRISDSIENYTEIKHEEKDVY